MRAELMSDESQSQPEMRGDLFEMRRLESLSNTIFGVAMTLLAYDAPKASNFSSAPSWSDLHQAYAGRLSGLALSFIIAGIFWFSHHRRLVRQPWGSRWVVLLNLLFLLSIILLPVTNGLYGNFGASDVVVVLYGLHLTAIASLNALLWLLATHDGSYLEAAGSVYTVLILSAGTVVAWFAPHDAQFVWYFAFGGLVMRRLVHGKR
jgi:uncharacterized membrane protein